MRTILIFKPSIPNFIKEELIDYPTPSNLNYLWSFGSLSGFCLLIQIITGVILAMHYTPHADMAFYSIEHIMRDIDFGWLLRYIHSNGASFFFLVVYIHIARGLFFSSYFRPKQYLWISGVIIYILMIGTAFLGYVLPWGQMSFWAATVITNIITALPFGDGGESFAIWLWGGFSVDNPTLNRFFSLHYLFPFLLVALIIVHLYILHMEGSSDPLLHTFDFDMIPFYPYFVLKDIFGISVLFCILLFFVCFFPNYLGHPDNYVEANSLVTPKHIVPEWYFLPFYGMLRSIPNKFAGIAIMFFAIVALILLPFTLQISFSIFYTDPIIHYTHEYLMYSYIYDFWHYESKELYRYITCLFMINFFLLGWLGGKPVEPLYIYIGLISTFFYFFYFFFLLFLYRHDKKLYIYWFMVYATHEEPFEL